MLVQIAVFGDDGILDGRLGGRFALGSSVAPGLRGLGGRILLGG
jgi:hypothetical protein